MVGCTRGILVSHWHLRATVLQLSHRHRVAVVSIGAWDLWLHLELFFKVIILWEKWSLLSFLSKSRLHFVLRSWCYVSFSFSLLNGIDKDWLHIRSANTEREFASRLPLEKAWQSSSSLFINGISRLRFLHEFFHMLFASDLVVFTNLFLVPWNIVHVRWWIFSFLRVNKLVEESILLSKAHCIWGAGASLRELLSGRIIIMSCWNYFLVFESRVLWKGKSLLSSRGVDGYGFIYINAIRLLHL